MPLEKYPDEAIARARLGALDWLVSERNGYPLSWEQERANDERRGYVMYDDFEAPPIAGYEALEREGRVTRVGIVKKDGQERVHFALIGQ